MNEQWQSLLDHHDLTHLMAQKTADFSPATDTSQGSFIACLTDWACLSFSGPDRHTFLQGQVTCDLKNTTGGKAIPGAQCNLKGRAYGTFIALEQNDTTLLLMPEEQTSYFKELLQKFIVFSKADMLVDKDLYVWGALSPAPLAEAGWHVLGDTQLQLCVANAESSAALVTQAKATNTPILAAPEWHSRRLAGGIAMTNAKNREQWIPQELNYDLIGGIGFKKGCYKGQEVIARIHYKGQVKQRTFPCLLPSAEMAPTGSPILDRKDGKTVGQVLESIALSSNKTLLLCCLKTEKIEHSELLLEQKDASQLRVLQPPYAITK